MIPPLNVWQSHNRAAHGKKIDTPSLGWACFEVQMVPVGTMQKTQCLCDRRFRMEPIPVANGTALSGGAQ